MAKLPGVLDLGVASAPETRPVGSYDTTPWARGAQALAQGEEAFAHGVSRVGAGMGDLAIDQSRFEYAQAHAVASSGLATIHGDAEQDRNYGPDAGDKGYYQRYSDRIEDTVNTAATTISDPNMRARFQSEMAPQVARSRAVLSVAARGLYNNGAIASERAQSTTDINTGATATSDDAKKLALDGINSRIDALGATGAYTPEQVVALKQQRVGEFAKADFQAAKNSNDSGRMRAAMNAIQGNSGNHLYDVIDPVLKQHLIAEGQAALARYDGNDAGAAAIASTASKPIAGGTLPPDTAAFLRARSGSARVDGINPTFADALTRAASDFEAQNPGRQASFESMKRTTAEQAVLYQRYQSGQGGLAAPPGQSRHEVGLAADVPDGAFLDWLHANAPRYGLEFLKGRAFQNDSGHVQLASGATVQPAAFTPTSPTGGGNMTGGGTVSLPPTGALRADAYRTVMDNPDLSDEARTHALAYIDRTVRAAQIADDQTRQAKTEAVNQAASGYVSEMWDALHTANPDFVALAGRINHDPAFAEAPQVKEQLLERVARHSGEEQALGYGPGYLAARRGLFSSPDDPNHIDDMASLVDRTDITLSGLQDLATRLRITRTDVDRSAVEKRVSSFLAYAKGKLSFEQDMGPIKIRDPEGEGIFTGQFVPEFVKRASALADQAQKTGDSSKLDDYLSKDNVDKLIRSYRDPREMQRQRLAASGDAGAQQSAPGALANEPIPPTPEGLNPAGWVPLVKSPPITASGKTWPMSNWGQALEYLAKNPDAETKGAFDRYFDKTGVTADQVLAKLKPAASVPAVMPTPTPAAAPAPAPAAAAALPPRPTPHTAEEFAAARAETLAEAASRTAAAEAQRKAEERAYNAGVAERGVARATAGKQSRAALSQSIVDRQIADLDAEEKSINEGVQNAQTPLTSMVANRRLEQIAQQREALQKKKR